MRKTFFLLILIVLLLSCYNVNASPEVSFTSASTGGKAVLTPAINSDVTHYKWSIILKGGGYESETEWIASADIVDHTSYLDNGHYLVTITGKNTDTDEETSFTNKVMVTIKAKYVEPEEEETVEGRISLIIDSMPEPLRSFLLRRNSFELGLMIIGSLLGVLIISRRTKIKKYVLLEKYHDKE